MRKKRRGTAPGPYEQLTFEHIKLNTGDRLFMNGSLYAEIAGESEDLYFLKKASSGCDMPTPFFKRTIIEHILFGKLAPDILRFQ